MESDSEHEGWELFGVPVAEVPAWKALEFGPFDAALAHGDGFTPTDAVHYRRQLCKTANRWRRTGLASAEGLRWHRAGFAVTEAVRWRSLGVEVETARARRDGWGVGFSTRQSPQTEPPPGTGAARPPPSRKRILDQTPGERSCRA